MYLRKIGSWICVIAFVAGCQKKDIPEPSSAKPASPTIQSGSEKKPEDTAESALQEQSGPSEEQIRAWVAEATSRKACNRVMGCPVTDKLLETGTAAVPLIIEAYQQMHRPVYQKFHLLTLLGRIGSRQAETFLLGELDASYWQSRTQGAIALGRIGSQSLKGKLRARFDALQEGTNTGMRFGLAYALVKLGASEYADVLVDGINPDTVGDVNWGYTRIAVELAGELALRRTCPYLPWTIRHPDLFLKQAGLETAGLLRCSQREVQEAAADLLAHKVDSVREAAGDTLENMTGIRFNTRRAWINYRTRHDGKRK